MLFTSLAVGAELFFIVISEFNSGMLLLLWAINLAAALIVLSYIVYCFSKLRQGGRALADGSLTCSIDTRFIIGEALEHANDLMNIREGINRAVNERMKSERFQSELITNVSHDIKTPLTSIVNYVDLLAKEELMKRFVRGDSPRSGEGSGLGLAIAKSLCELQNGEMELVLDGDLFKVIIKLEIKKTGSFDPVFVVK